MMQRITTYMENGRKFFICKASDQGDANGYWAFEDKNVDPKTGELLKQFNGINGHQRTSHADVQRDNPDGQCRN